MTGRIDITHGPYRIIAGVVKNTPQAIAYIGNRASLRSEGDSPEQAVVRLKELIDAERARRSAKRPGGVPTASEFQEALSGIVMQLDGAVVDQLRHHLRVIEATATLEVLARLTGHTVEDTLRGYAALGRRLGRLLEFAPAAASIERKEQPILVFATLSDDPAPLRRSWTLRPEAVDGFGPVLAREPMIG